MKGELFQKMLIVLACMMLLALALVATKDARAGGAHADARVGNVSAHSGNSNASADNDQSNVQTVTSGSLDSQQSVNIESQRQVPGLGMGISGDCIGAGLQLAVPIFGFTATASDKDCQKLRAAYFARAMGDDKLARKLLLATDAVKGLDEPQQAPVPTGWERWGD